jgi:hypothetical protein
MPELPLAPSYSYLLLSYLMNRALARDCGDGTGGWWWEDQDLLLDITIRKIFAIKGNVVGVDGRYLACRAAIRYDDSIL